MHKRIAKLTAWSMQSAGTGKWPHLGFEGESFPSGTIRFKRQGTELANGWKKLEPNMKKLVYFIVGYSTILSHYQTQGLLLQLQSGSQSSSSDAPASKMVQMQFVSRSKSIYIFEPIWIS